MIGHSKNKWEKSRECGVNMFSGGYPLLKTTSSGSDQSYSYRTSRYTRPPRLIWFVDTKTLCGQVDLTSGKPVVLRGLKWKEMLVLSLFGSKCGYTGPSNLWDNEWMEGWNAFPMIGWTHSWRNIDLVMKINQNSNTDFPPIFPWLYETMKSYERHTSVLSLLKS